MRLANRSTISYLSFVIVLMACILILGFDGQRLNVNGVADKNVLYFYIFVFFVSLVALRGLYLRVRYSLYLGITTISLVILSFPFFGAIRIPVLIVLLVVAVIVLYFLIKFQWYYNFPTKLFDRPELSISIVVIIIVLVYGMAGTVLLSNQFNPHINNITTAFYYTGEVITTLGFGDIVPVTHVARIFTVTLSIVGIASFFGSATVIAAPLIYSRSKRVISVLEKIESAKMKNFVLFVDYCPLMRPLLDSLIANDYLIIVGIDSESMEKELPENGIFVERNRSLEMVIDSFDLRNARKIILAGADDGKNVLNAIHINTKYPDGAVRDKTVAMVNISSNSPKLGTLVGQIISPADLIAKEAEKIF